MRVQRVQGHTIERREYNARREHSASVQSKSAEARVKGREYRECEGTESRGTSTMHDESTV